MMTEIPLRGTATCALSLALFAARADSVAVATGSSATVAPSVAEVAAGETCVFAYHNDIYSILEGSAFLRSADGNPVRVWYWFEDGVEFPLDLPAGSGLSECPVVYGSSPVGEHTITFRPERDAVFDRLDFYTTKTDVLPDGRSLTSLPPVDRASRIAVRDVGYVPEDVGEAEVLVWKDDKTAAATITVDDNHADEIDWWLEQAARFGARITWFVIGSKIGLGHAANGSWEDFQRVLDAGHDVQSHTYSHFADADMTAAAEYTNNIAVIERNLPGHKVVALAYPGGAQMRKNTAMEAMKYHIGARGATADINEAGKTNYRSTFSSHGESPDLNPESRYYLGNMVNKTSPYPSYYRGWNCHHSHNLTAEYREGVMSLMSFYATNNVWMAGYVDVLKYGQERDTARVETKVNAAARIVVELTDRMDDALFDYPLSVVLHVPDDWSGFARVVQGSTTNVVPVRTAASVRSVVFDAIPDRGEIEIVPTDAPAGGQDDPQGQDAPPAPADPPAADGPGTASSAETIATAEEFAAKVTPAAASGERYRLVADIALSGWTPVDFSAELDGDGHVLTGLTGPLFGTLSGSLEDLVVDGGTSGGPTVVSGIDADFGVVARTNCGGRVSGVVLRNFSLQTLVAATGKRHGFLCGVAMDGASFEGCTVEPTCAFGLRYCSVGGIAGVAGMSAAWTGPSGADLVVIASCTNRGSITATSSGGCALGGMLGAASVADETLRPRILVTNCVSFCNLTSTYAGASGSAGGMVGERYLNIAKHVDHGRLEIVDCVNRGAIGPLGNGNAAPCYLGGAVGNVWRLGNVILTRFCNYGSVGSESDPTGQALVNGFAGGLVGGNGQGTTSTSIWGNNPIVAVDCANYGDVIGAKYAGGFISSFVPGGTVDNSFVVFTNCANYGSVRTVVAGGKSGQAFGYIPTTVATAATRRFGCLNCFFVSSGLCADDSGTELLWTGSVTAEDADYESPRKTARSLTAGARAAGLGDWCVGRFAEKNRYPELVAFCAHPVVSGMQVCIR